MHKTTTALALAAALAAGFGTSAQATTASNTTWKTLNGTAPIVIGHRGASGYRPEHTLESYDLAISMGANYIEPDLVMTRDGVLVARHEPMLDGTTDVAAKFDASRKTTRMVDGVSTTAYFADTFDLAELKTLRAKQSRAGRSSAYDGQFQVPTLDEVIALAKQRSSELGRTIGIYPEIKHSTYMQAASVAAGRDANYFEDKLVSTLHEAYGNSSTAPVFIQSFETANLKYLNGKTDIKLVQLVDADDVNPNGSMSLVAPYAQPYDIVAAGGSASFADLLTPAGLAAVKLYADGIGPWKPYLVKTVADGVDRTGDGVLNGRDRLVEGSTGVIEAAHQAGLLVHTWTFRNDDNNYSLGFASPQAEMEYYMKLGVDGVFTDFPDTGVAALQAVPEPGTWALMLGGVALLAARRRRAA